MSKVIQQVEINSDVSLYITEFDNVTNMMSFRTSYEPQRLQEEEITVDEQVIRTSMYYFPITYLQQFINQNK